MLNDLGEDNRLRYNWIRIRYVLWLEMSGEQGVVSVTEKERKERLGNQSNPLRILLAFEKNDG